MKGWMTEGLPELERGAGLAGGGGGDGHINYKRIRVLSLSIESVLCGSNLSN